jgi:hypothetical protein
LTLVMLVVTRLSFKTSHSRVVSIMSVISLVSERRESDTQRFAIPANSEAVEASFPQIPQQFAGQFSELQALCLLKAGKLGNHRLKSPCPLRS